MRRFGSLDVWPTRDFGVSEECDCSGLSWLHSEVTEAKLQISSTFRDTICRLHLIKSSQNWSQRHQKTMYLYIHCFCILSLSYFLLYLCRCEMMPLCLEFQLQTGKKNPSWDGSEILASNISDFLPTNGMQGEPTKPPVKGHPSDLVPLGFGGNPSRLAQDFWLNDFFRWIT